MAALVQFIGSSNQFIDAWYQLIKYWQETENGFFVVKADGNLESSIVLINEFMEYLHQSIGTQLMIGMPATNLLWIADAEKESNVIELKKAMIHFFKTENQPGMLSKSLYIRTSGNANLAKVWSCEKYNTIFITFKNKNYPNAYFYFYNKKTNYEKLFSYSMYHF